MNATGRSIAVASVGRIAHLPREKEAPPQELLTPGARRLRLEEPGRAGEK